MLLIVLGCSALLSGEDEGIERTKADKRDSIERWAIVGEAVCFLCKLLY